MMIIVIMMMIPHWKDASAWDSLISRAVVIHTVAAVHQELFVYVYSLVSHGWYGFNNNTSDFILNYLSNCQKRVKICYAGWILQKGYPRVA